MHPQAQEQQDQHQQQMMMQQQQQHMLQQHMQHMQQMQQFHHQQLFHHHQHMGSGCDMGGMSSMGGTPYLSSRHTGPDPIMTDKRGGVVRMVHLMYRCNKRGTSFPSSQLHVMPRVPLSRMIGTGVEGLALALSASSLGNALSTLFFRAMV
jgi:hypothetical protein